MFPYWQARLCLAMNCGLFMLQVLNAREKKIQIDDCNKFTEHLIMVLPKLLNKVPNYPISYFSNIHIAALETVVIYVI